jgi:hypothetical protein
MLHLLTAAKWHLSAQSAARNLGREITILNASAVPDIDAAFAKLVEMRADTLLGATDPFFFDRAPQLVVLALAMRFPRCTPDVSSPRPAGS